MSFREPARLVAVLLSALLTTVTLATGATAAPLAARPALTSLAPYPPLVASAAATPNRLTVGDCAEFTGGGFAVGSSVSFTDNGVSFGTVPSDAGGAFRLRRCFDGAVPCGVHDLVATGQRTDSTAVSESALVTMICVVQTAPGGTLALGGRTSAGGLPVLLIGLLVMALLGLLLLLLRALAARRRNRPEPS